MLERFDSGMLPIGHVARQSQKIKPDSLLCKRPLPEELTWSIVKEMLRNAPAILGALTVGGILVGLPLAISGYYLSFAAVNKYQQRVKEQLAVQKARLVNTKEQVKQKIHQRRMKK